MTQQARLKELLNIVSRAVRIALADRQGHLRMDDDGAPPTGEIPIDPYRDLVRHAALLSLENAKRMMWARRAFREQ
jgi:hypothetical protein